MITIAVVAALAYGETLRQRRSYFLGKATAHPASEKQYSKYEADVRDLVEALTVCAESDKEREAEWERERRARSGDPRDPMYWRLVEHWRAVDEWENREKKNVIDVTREVLAEQAKVLASMTLRARRYALLKKKYARAARYPWLAVEPDAPEPN
jgi:hypothetical protein